MTNQLNYIRTKQIDKQALVDQFEKVWDSKSEYQMNASIYGTEPNVDLGDWSGRTTYSNMYHIITFSENHNDYQIPSVRIEEVIKHHADLPTMFKNDVNRWVKSVRCNFEGDWLTIPDANTCSYDISNFAEIVENTNQNVVVNILANYDSSNDIMEYAVVNGKEMNQFIDEIKAYFGKKATQVKIQKIKDAIKELSDTERAEVISMLIK